MKYPKEFVENVKAAFPNWAELHEALDNGSVIVGHCLNSNRRFEMSPTTIVTAFNRGQEYKVKEEAEKAILCADFYGEWDKFCEANKQDLT